MRKLSRRDTFVGLATLPLLLSANVRSVLSIGLLAESKQPDIPSGVQLVMSDGYHTPGLGQGFYAADARVNAGFNQRHPQGSFIAADGRGFRLSDRRPNPYQFGAVGDGTHDDTAIWEALCAFATELKLPRITLGSASLGGRKPFLLPIGIDIDDDGGKFVAVTPFTGDELVATPSGKLYLDTHLATLRADVANLRNTNGRPISAFRFRWIGYIKVERLEGENITGNGIIIEPGDRKSSKGASRDLFCDFVEMRASKQVDFESAGVTIDGSDHVFQYGTCVGFPVGGSSPGANNFLGVWHVWSAYHNGWPQMRLGWDASGEGNQGTIEVDSPGAVNPSLPATPQNGPIGLYIHGNGIRNDLKVIINVSKWGSATVRPRTGSIVPVLINQSHNKIAIDVVDYAGRGSGSSSVAHPWAAFVRPNLATSNSVSYIGQ